VQFADDVVAAASPGKLVGDADGEPEVSRALAGLARAVLVEIAVDPAAEGGDEFCVGEGYWGSSSSR
jgi:hypothetical protein